MPDQTRSEDTAVMLGLLSAVERDSAVTQRLLSRELGIALGLANAYLKRCIGKGLIKVRQAPLNRYAYYLTPGGFAEKSRLTAEYLTISLNFFRDARRECDQVMADCARRGFSRVALAGEGELAEIAVLSATDKPLEIVCVIARQATERLCAGKPVVTDLAQAARVAASGGGLDAVMVTDVRAAQATFEALRRSAGTLGLAPDRVLVLPLLRVSDQPAVTIDEDAGP